MRNSMRFFVIFNLSISLANAVECESYVGSRPTTITFDQASKKFDNLTPKSEFETTLEFEARQKIIADSLGNNDLIILNAFPEGYREGIKYNADKKEFNITPRALGLDSYYRMLKIFIRLNYDLTKNRDIYSKSYVTIFVNQDTQKTGEYQAINQNGVSVTVKKIKVLSNIIYDGSNLFPQAMNSKLDTLGPVKIEPDGARKFKDSVKFAFVIKPKEPYFLSGSHKTNTPKFNDLRDIDEDFFILFATVKCALVIDETGVTVAAFKANK